MPRREDIKSVMVIGSGPIVIGQACEFDYSGTQACRVLRAEGLRVVLVNSNPATIMTDPEFSDATYIEPITPDFVERIIAKERPDALLPTLGGQTALNTADRPAQERCARAVRGRADRRRRRRHRAGREPRAVPEDRGRHRAESARSAICHSSTSAWTAVEPTSATRWSCVPSFTMGGSGSGIAYDEADLLRIAGAGLQASPTTEMLLEESIIGWKEYELELMRDHHDNVVVVCSIENVDPMGVHTGDSITVAPALTLTDREYQHLRERGHRDHPGGRRRHRRLQHPVRRRSRRRAHDRDRDEPARLAVVARWPRKATGFPIAKIAAGWRSATRSTRSATTSPG